MPAEGSWFIKHTVWFGLAAVIFAYAELLSDTGQNTAYRLQDSVFYVVGRELAAPGRRFVRPECHANQLVHCRLLSFAGLFDREVHDFAVRKGILAFGLAMGGSIIACQIWALFASWRLPLWWTVGPIPAVSSPTP